MWVYFLYGPNGRRRLRRIWHLPNTTHSDLLHLLSDELPVFDELCRRYLMLIYNVCLYRN